MYSWSFYQICAEICKYKVLVVIITWQIFVAVVVAFLLIGKLQALSNSASCGTLLTWLARIGFKLQMVTAGKGICSNSIWNTIIISKIFFYVSDSVLALRTFERFWDNCKTAGLRKMSGYTTKRHRRQLCWPKKRTPNIFRQMLCD